MATAVIDKVGKARNLPLEEYNFVKAHSSFPTKVTLPSLAHASVLYSPGVSDKVYPDRAVYLHEVLELTAQLVQECIDAAARTSRWTAPATPTW